ncbi:MAG: 30S ribosomal protein S6 [Spirochaetes bacterium RBG_13_51_14]|nr:MAG: 30S ribosomal protein S6 [Spirochaetes bacterium RBG_13_51_14]
MITYELTVILRNKEVESLIDRVKDILKKHGAGILSDNSLGVKKLAYEIDRESEGYYLFMNAQIPPDSVKKIISEFRLNNNILRHLFVKIKKAAIA